MFRNSFLNASSPPGNSAFWKFALPWYSYWAVVACENALLLSISKGKIDKLDVLPKFKNNEMFVDDMKYALKKVKGKWSPATKGGVPVDSKAIMKIRFNNNTYDHD